MSMKSVRRSLFMLRSSLEASGICCGFPDGAALPSRYEELHVLYLMHDVMERSPELSKITLHPNWHQGSEVFVEAQLEFTVEAGGEVNKFSMDPEESVENSINGIIEKLGGRNSKDRERLEALKKALDETLDYFAENRAEMHSVPLWTKESSLIVTRETYAASFVAGVFDEEVFRALVLQEDHPEVADMQRDLTGAPIFWNSASVQTIPARLRAGLDPQACDANGVLPLVAAAVYGNAGAIEELLVAGASPDMVDGTGNNSVSAAIAAGREDIFDLLVARGASLNGPYMVPTLLVALEINNGAELIGKLMDAGVDLRAKMPDGKPFYPGFERFFSDGDPASQRRFRAIAEFVSSTVTERAVVGAMADASSPGAGQSKSMGMML